MPRRARTVQSLGIALLVGVVAACSSSTSKASSPTPSSTTTKPAASTPARPTPASCTSPDAGKKIIATKVSGVASDWDLSSFDGTKIRIHWFPAPQASATHRLPTVLMGPGWGSPGATDNTSIGVLGALSVESLRQAGFNVLTWDPRGFGQSGGTVEVDSAQFEGRDVEKMIDWVATQPDALLDRAGDPRVGMAGGSYGGGIQLIAAAIDCRIDAIVPEIAWHSLTTSLDKADTPKNGWAGILIAATNGRSVDPHIRHAYQASITTAVIDPADRAWFAQRGPDNLVARITAPTLIIQGTVDNLFTLDEGIENYRILRAHGVPTSMIWFCGGHGVCLTNAGDPAYVQTRLINWLDRYLKRDTGVDTGPRFDLVDQNGVRYSGDDYPLPTGTPITANGHGTLALQADGGSGPAHPAADNSQLLAGIAGPITPGRATNAVNVGVDFTAPAVVVGAPQLTFSYHGTSPAGVKPTRAFAQLVDDATGLVVGNQVTPIKVTLDGRMHHVSVPLEVVAFTGHAGAHLTLQLVATTVAYAQPRFGGTIDFTAVGVSLPVASGLTAK